MNIQDKVVVVTGGASGIGRAMARRFAADGARAVVIADLDQSQASAAADEIGGLGVACDVSVAEQVEALVARATRQYGAVHVFCSNAGISTGAGLEPSLDVWQRNWDVNLMAHVHAAHAVLPQMLARGEGYLLQTASAAGLLTSVTSATYSVSKHATVAFAEWLAIHYGDRGVRVSCLCPQGVVTPMLVGKQGERKSFLTEGAMSPEDVAAEVVRCMQEERFLVLPHPEVLKFMQRKTGDYDRWIAGMRKVRDKAEAVRTGQATQP